METHSEYSGFRGKGSLQDLVSELNRQKETKVDFVADTRNLNIVDSKMFETSFADPNGVVCAGGDFIPHDGIDILPQALQQIGQKSTPEIPWKFLQKLQDQKPRLTDDLLNGMLADGNRRMIRCLDGKVRAFLSDRYRVLDNLDLAFQALETVQKLDGEVLECNLTDKNMRIKFTSRQIWDSIEERRTSAPSSDWYAGGMGNQEHLSRVAARTGGDLPGGPGTVHPVVTITNSETGHGGLRIRIGILRAICFNLATVEDVAAQIHLGGANDLGIFSEETVSEESKVVWMKCRDAITTAFDKDRFSKLVARANHAQTVEIEKPSEAVASIVSSESIDEDTKDSILEHFLRDYDSTAYGLAQAISRASQDTPDSDKSTELESIAGKIIMTPKMVLVA